MRILISGSRGMLGTALRHRLALFDLIIPEKHQLNVGNFEQVSKLKDTKIDFIIHLAAETDHEYCEENPSQCYFINTIGTANMVWLANEHFIPILYMSTGSVFDGKKGKPYTNEDEPNPINHYNKSKYYGEVIVITS